MTLRGHFSTHYNELKTFAKQSNLPLTAAFVAPAPAPLIILTNPFQASGHLVMLLW